MCINHTAVSVHQQNHSVALSYSDHFQCFNRCRSALNTSVHVLNGCCTLKAVSTNSKSFLSLVPIYFDLTGVDYHQSISFDNVPKLQRRMTEVTWNRKKK